MRKHKWRCTLVDVPDFKLGKLPARPDAVSLKLANYVDRSKLPKVPADFGHYDLVTQFPMFDNDRYGDCVWAGAAHEHQLWVAQGRGVVDFSDAAVLRAYSAVTGFDPSEPDSDQGTDMELAAKYRRRTGIHDVWGAAHKVAAYVGLDAGNLDQVALAGYLFGAVGVGIEFPAFAMDQFDAGQPWDVARKNTKIEGGHYVPIVGRRGGNYLLVTWGKLIEATPKFLTKYMDEGIAYLSTEILYGGKSIEGFNNAALLDNLRRVTSVRAPAPSETQPRRKRAPRKATT